jgi:hypothetical protein
MLDLDHLLVAGDQTPHGHFFFIKREKKKVMPNIDPWSACQSLIGRTPCHCDSSDNDWSTYRHKKTISGHGDAL